MYNVLSNYVHTSQYCKHIRYNINRLNTYKYYYGTINSDTTLATVNNGSGMEYEIE